MTPDDVPSGPLLVDTGVFGKLLRASASDVAWQQLVQGHRLLLSFVTIGEVFHGAIKRGWGPERWAALEASLGAYGVIPGTAGIARKWGELAAAFGTSEGVNDMWIAATALSYESDSLPIVTANGDFVRMATTFPLVVVGV